MLRSRENGRRAGGRPGGAGQPPPEGGAECSGPEEPGVRGGRRLRTAFSAEQLSTLESSFQRQQYLGAAERRKLAGRMRLSEVQIKTWFQNRRMKLKRQLQELRTEPFCSPPPPLRTSERRRALAAHVRGPGTTSAPARGCLCGLHLGGGAGTRPGPQQRLQSTACGLLGGTLLCGVQGSQSFLAGCLTLCYRL
ncbi:brain-specific homeobox protein homolog [Accipiter gentilis]|uniref:brain-specific homeobox protein homolog n=1 Tax=Astur gentilis TaxID=8957 RepID=UPI00210F4B88|nr:brain-specific homeobox protein homolog [Accipiter gentilis]